MYLKQNVYNIFGSVSFVRKKSVRNYFSFMIHVSVCQFIWYVGRSDFDMSISHRVKVIIRIDTNGSLNGIYKNLIFQDT